jgi:hypothetical protein
VVGEIEQMADESLANPAVLRAASDLLARSMIASQAGITFGGKRNLYNAFGYKRKLFVKDYRERYARNGIATRVVEAFPNATWRGHAELIEDEDPDYLTPFEDAWAKLDTRLNLWAVFRRADILAGLGRYSVILLGAPGKMDEALRSFPAEQLQYLQVFDEEDARIDRLVVDETSPRFGLPEFYKIKMSSENASPNAVRSRSKKVHWSRVLHVADGCLDDTLYGRPRLEKVWNLLDDLEKVSGAGAEAFWRRAHKGLIFKFDPEIKLGDAEKKSIEDAAEEMVNDFRRTMGVRGAEVQDLGSDVAQFSGPIDGIITLIAGSTEIPKRILVGSERGELASTQDKTSWGERVSDRRDSFAEPNIVRPLVRLLIKHQALPPVKEFDVRWPDIAELEETQKVELAVKLAPTTQLGLITPDEIRDRYLGMEPLQGQQQEEGEEVPVGEEVRVEPPALRSSKRRGPRPGKIALKRVAEKRKRWFTRAVKRAVTSAKEKVDLSALVAALSDRSPGKAASAVGAALADYHAFLREEITPAVLETMVEGAEVKAAGGRRGA